MSAHYADPGGWLDGKPAIATRRVGKGRITYVGAWLDPEAMRSLANTLLNDAGIRPIVAGADPDLEISARAGAGRCVLVAINHGTVAHPLPMPAKARLVAGTLSAGVMAPHAVAVLEIPGDAACR